MAMEFGRPGTGTRLTNIKPVTTALAIAGIKFELKNPSLYRQGTYNSLKNDYIFISRPEMNIHDKGAHLKLRKSLKPILKIKHANMESLTAGATMIKVFNLDKLIESLEDNLPLMCSFYEREKVVTVYYYVWSWNDIC